MTGWRCPQLGVEWARLDGVVIGTVSLDVVDGMGQPGMPPRTEAQLGYIFDPAYGGHG